MGQMVEAGGAVEGCRGLWGPARSPALNARRRPQGPGWVCGIRLSPALVLTCPQIVVLSCQVPREGPLSGQPRVRDRPQQPGMQDPPTVQRAERQDEVRVRGRGSMGPMVNDAGCHRKSQGARGPCSFSRPECSAAPRWASVDAWL